MGADTKIEWCHHTLRRLGRWLIDVAEPRVDVVTDRAHLLRVDARREGDHCAAFVAGSPGTGRCSTDGHYLCGECAQMRLEELVYRHEDDRRWWPRLQALGWQGPPDEQEVPDAR